MRFESCGSASMNSVWWRLRDGALALAFLSLLAAPAFAAGMAADAAVPWVEALRTIPLRLGTRLVEAPAGASAADAEQSLHDAGYDIAVSIPPRVHVVRSTRRAGSLPAGFILRSEGTVASAPATGALGADREGACANAPLWGGAALATGDPFGGLADALPPLRGARDASRGREALRSGTAPPLPTGLVALPQSVRP